MRSTRSQTLETFRQYLRRLNLRDAQSILKEIAEATLRQHSRRDGSSSVARTVQCVPHSSTQLESSRFAAGDAQNLFSSTLLERIVLLGEYYNLGHLRPRLCWSCDHLDAPQDSHKGLQQLARDKPHQQEVDLWESWHRCQAQQLQEWAKLPVRSKARIIGIAQGSSLCKHHFLTLAKLANVVIFLSSDAII